MQDAFRLREDDSARSSSAGSSGERPGAGRENFSMQKHCVASCCCLSTLSVGVRVWFIEVPIVHCRTNKSPSDARPDHHSGDGGPADTRVLLPAGGPAAHAVHRPPAAEAGIATGLPEKQLSSQTHLLGLQC